jgi:ornithine cyclodeaminase
VGFALEDYSALTFMRDAAAEFGIGESIELVPNSADPKNLYSLLAEEPQAALREAAMA